MCFEDIQRDIIECGYHCRVVDFTRILPFDQIDMAEPYSYDDDPEKYEAQKIYQIMIELSGHPENQPQWEAEFIKDTSRRITGLLRHHASRPVHQMSVEEEGGHKPRPGLGLPTDKGAWIRFDDLDWHFTEGTGSLPDSRNPSGRKRTREISGRSGSSMFSFWS